jgi:hypothetical protein
MQKILHFIELLLKFCLIGISGWFIAVLVYCISKRIGFPFELEWLEGDMLLTAVRVLEHKSIYTAPSMDYMCGIYPPFYYIAVAAAFWLLEPSLLVLRGVSVLSLILIFILIYSIVSRETRLRWLAFVSIGIFASFYDAHASWYDIGRLDSFFYCLLLFGLWLASQINRWKWAAVGSSIVLCLAIFTKQSTAIYIPFVILFLFLRNKKQSLIFTVVFSTLCCLFFLYLEVSSNGWFSNFTILKPISFPKDQERVAIIINDIFKVFPVLLLLAGAGVATVFFRWRKWAEISIWEIIFIPSIIAYIRIRPISGAEANDSIYLTLWLSIMVPIWLQKFVLAGKGTSYRKCFNSIVLALLCIQLMNLLYRPSKWLPLGESVTKGEELILRLRAAPGPVFVHLHPVYAWLAGKKPFLNACNVWAYNLGGDPIYSSRDLLEKVSNEYFSVIVLDDVSISENPELCRRIKINYAVESNIDYGNNMVFRPITGYRPRPVEIWIPKTSQSTGNKRGK